MKEIETISDLAACTDITLLKEQRQAYTDVMDAYYAEHHMFAEAIKMLTTEKEFRSFMALYVAAQMLTARIKELEETK